MPSWPAFGILCSSSSAHLSVYNLLTRGNDQGAEDDLRDLLEEARLGQIDDNTNTPTDIEHEV